MQIVRLYEIGLPAAHKIFWQINILVAMTTIFGCVERQQLQETSFT
jgi:small basic protein